MTTGFSLQIEDSFERANAQVLACSEFVTRSFAVDLDFWATPAARLLLTKAWQPEQPWANNNAADEPLRSLRVWRRREMTRIAFRDLAGWAGIEATLAHLSAFADAAIRAAYAQAWVATTRQFGTPRDPQGHELPLVVIGMGKLGGRELNFSSDIDLIFLFPESGETDATPAVSFSEFYVRLGQALIHLLSAPTVDGIVFRVDMRLRPFGDSGPLACSFAALEDYLLQQGRDWERYAWVKARAITGVSQYAKLFAETVRPFVFRRYLDFGVFESLREMKLLIEKQVVRRELADNVKLGPGGIREIEFIVQALQLIRGGQDARLQSPSLLQVLPLLSGGRLLAQSVVDELRTCYQFLRRLENRLQMLRDAQTHQMPTQQADQVMIARSMAQDSYAGVLREWADCRATVQRHFAALLFAARGDAETAKTAVPMTQRESAADWTEHLQTLGFTEATEAARLLVELRHVPRLKRMDESSQRRLQLLLDLLVQDCAAAEPSKQLVLLRRFMRVIEAIGQRSSYFALLNENVSARQRFAMLCATSDFLVSQLAAFPLLLDELLDEREFGVAPQRSQLAADLNDRLARVGTADDERVHEALCHFKQAAVFRIAVADLTGKLPLMQVSDRLTDVAELIVDAAMQLAWRQITAQFGTPCCHDEANDLAGEKRIVRVCALGYGKLGGMELGYASDLDLVFLHDSAGTEQETDSTSPVDNQVFFVRLAQRILHLLSMYSAAGRLYEIDVRLRPSGKGGMLITGIEAFRRYQRTEAWTWEHQALLHARAVAGDPGLRARFADLRISALMEDVKRDTLRDEVANMRGRMRRELSKAKAGEFDLKQDAGGMADIEFLAQYWALKFAAEKPPVALFSDTIRQLESVASADLVPQSTVDVLTNAYREYRARAHLRSLQDEGSVIRAEDVSETAAAVRCIWDATLGEPAL